jgi:hypothetical protein
MDDDEILRRAAQILGKRTSERKAASSRANAAKATAAIPAGKPCNCGHDPHRSTCPVYRREAQRKHRAKP